MKLGVSLTLVAFTILIPSSLGQDDYDSELQRAAKGEAEPYEPSPPPPPNPEEVIPTTEGPLEIPSTEAPPRECHKPDLEQEGDDDDEFGAFLANFYSEESANSDRITQLAKKSCSNLSPKIADTLTHIGLPHGKCLKLFDKPNCAGNTVDFHYDHLSFALKFLNFDNKAKSFRVIHCDVPCKETPTEQGIEGDSFEATFYAEESTDSEHATLTVNPTCSDLPPNLANTLTAVSLPEGKCITLYRKPNCCGRMLPYYYSHATNHIKHAQWNDESKSFHSRPCEYPEEAPPERESFQVIFHEAIERNRDTIALDASSCCSNIPSKKTGHPGNSPWNEVVSDLDLPEGKCIRIYDKLNCEGKEMDAGPNSKSRQHMWDSGWDNRAKSFKAIPCEELVEPCQSGISVDGEDPFKATFYEDRRGENKDELTFDVTSTCANIPDSRTRNTNFLWPETITDVVVPWLKCICLFHEKDCSGESMYTTLSLDKFHIQKTSFNNKIASYRACNSGSGK